MIWSTVLLLLLPSVALGSWPVLEDFLETGCSSEDTYGNTLNDVDCDYADGPYRGDDESILLCRGASYDYGFGTCSTNPPQWISAADIFPEENPGTSDNFWWEACVKIAENPSHDDELVLLRNAGQIAVELYANPSTKKFWLRNVESSGTCTFARSYVPGKWHHIMLKVHNTTTDVQQAWMDRRDACTITTGNALSRTVAYWVGRIYGIGRTGVVQFDQVKIYDEDDPPEAAGGEADHCGIYYRGDLSEGEQGEDATAQR